MANANAPNGLMPVRHSSGGQIRYTKYPIASGTAANIFNGDPVKLTSSGVVTVAAAGDTNIVGVCKGVFYTDPTTKKPRFAPYFPTGTAASDAYALVIDDPNVIFSIQCSGTLAATAVGENADLDMGTSGSTTSGLSGAQISATTGTGTANLRIVGIEENPNNSYGANVRVLVQINEHAYVQRASGT